MLTSTTGQISMILVHLRPSFTSSAFALVGAAVLFTGGSLLAFRRMNIPSQSEPYRSVIMTQTTHAGAPPDYVMSYVILGVKVIVILIVALASCNFVKNRSSRFHA